MSDFSDAGMGLNSTFLDDGEGSNAQGYERARKQEFLTQLGLTNQNHERTEQEVAKLLNKAGPEYELVSPHERAWKCNRCNTENFPSSLGLKCKGCDEQMDGYNGVWLRAGKADVAKREEFEERMFQEAAKRQQQPDTAGHRTTSNSLPFSAVEEVIDNEVQDAATSLPVERKQLSSTKMEIINGIQQSTRDRHEQIANTTWETDVSAKDIKRNFLLQLKAQRTTEEEFAKKMNKRAWRIANSAASNKLKEDTSSMSREELAEKMDNAAWTTADSAASDKLGEETSSMNEEEFAEKMNNAAWRTANSAAIGELNDGTSSMSREELAEKLENAAWTTADSAASDADGPNQDMNSISSGSSSAADPAQQPGEELSEADVSDQPQDTSYPNEDWVATQMNHHLAPTDDSDNESVHSFTFSEATAMSFTEASTVGEVQTAVGELVRLLQNDPEICLACIKARAEQSIEGTDFETRLRRQLKDCSKQLIVEAKQPLEALVVRLLSTRARQVAREVTCLWWPEEAQTPSTPDVVEKEQIASMKLQRLNEWLSREAEGRDDDLVREGGTTEYDSDDDVLDSGLTLAALSRLGSFLTSSAAFDEMRKSFIGFAERPSKTREELIRRWKMETGTSVPWIIYRCKHNGITQLGVNAFGFDSLEDSGQLGFFSQDTFSWKDRLQMAVEKGSGELWNWWPISQPRYPLAPGLVRVLWKFSRPQRSSLWLDRCRQTLLKDSEMVWFKDVSENLGSALYKALEGRLFFNHEMSRPQTMVLTSAASGEPSKGVNDQQSLLQSPAAVHLKSSRRSPRDLAGAGQPQSNMALQANAARLNAGDHQRRYVLLSVPASRRIKSAELRVHKDQSDKVFIKELRKDYYAQRGFLCRWFSPKRFSHCCCSRLTKWAAGELAWKSHELPIQSEYEYAPPFEEPYCDPIPPDEWYRRFYQKVDTRMSADALMRMPKRCKAFQIATHMEREELWGLHVYYEFSALGIGVWAALISAGPMVFCGVWLKAYPQDIQTALTPLTTVIAVILALWMALGKDFVNKI